MAQLIHYSKHPPRHLIFVDIESFRHPVRIIVTPISEIVSINLDRLIQKLFYREKQRY